MYRLMVAAALSRALTDWTGHTGRDRHLVRNNDWMRREIGMDRASFEACRNDQSAK